MIEMVPDEELKRFEKIQWAPMVDFLFIIVIVFATLAALRTMVMDKELSLAEALPQKESASSAAPYATTAMHLSINHLGKYKWLSGNSELILSNPHALAQTLAYLKKQGVLPCPGKMTILLHIDKSAPWQPVADAIFTVREAGYDIRPVYQTSRGRR